MTSQAATSLKRESLSTTWLAARLGIEPSRLDAMRRGGELLGVRPAGTWEYLYPAWQFNGGGKALPIVQELIREARTAGMGDDDLYEVLNRRTGLVGAGRLVDVMRDGHEDFVREAVRAATRSGR
jgi:hypothetical protein